MSSVQPAPSNASLDEEDISHAGGWMEDSPSEASSSGSKRNKGKGKESDEETLRVDQTEEAEEGGPDDSGEFYAGADEYPPTQEEVEESRRVEEVRVSFAPSANCLAHSSSQEPPEMGNSRARTPEGSSRVRRIGRLAVHRH